VAAAAKPPAAKSADEPGKKTKQPSAAAPPEKPVVAAQAGNKSAKAKAPSPAVARKVEATPARVGVEKASSPKAEEAKGTVDRDRAIAAAVQRRAAESASKAKAESAIDQRIAAAVQRRAAQVGSVAAKPQDGAGGPVSSGPGDAVGGRRADLEYVLYQGRMEERVKQAWAWAGADPSLRATVQFSIAPDGAIRNVRIITASGDPSYDASVERAVRAVSPLDPPPERLREDFALVELTFQPEQGR
jgi:TolA protein